MEEQDLVFDVVDLSAESAAVGSVQQFRGRDGLEALAQGDVRLHFNPDKPPMQLLDYLISAAEQAERLGPVLGKGTAVSRINETVLRGGQRQSFSEAGPIGWAEDFSGLRELVLARLLDLDVSAPRLLLPLSSTVNKAIHDLGHRQRFAEFLTAEQMRTQNLADFMAPEVPVVYPNYVEYYQLPENWIDAYWKLRDLMGSVLGPRIDAWMKSGQILSVQERNGQFVLMAPGEFNTGRRRFRPKEVWFFLTCDMPPDWFTDEVELAVLKKEAARELLRVAKAVEGRHCRASVEQYVTLLMRRFAISRNAAQDVLKTTGYAGKGKSGKISSDMKISDSDLRSLK